MVREIIIEKGTNASSLSSLYDNSQYISSKFLSTDRTELYIKFNAPFPYLKTQADALEYKMATEGVILWKGYERYTFPSEDGKSLTVRWMHGNPFFMIVIALIISIIVVALVVLITAWVLKKVYPESPIFNFSNLSSKIAVVGLIGFALYLIIPRVIKSSNKPP